VVPNCVRNGQGTLVGIFGKKESEKSKGERTQRFILERREGGGVGAEGNRSGANANQRGGFVTDCRWENKRCEKDQTYGWEAKHPKKTQAAWG